jgi:hypothetical protein
MVRGARNAAIGLATLIAFLMFVTVWWGGWTGVATFTLAFYLSIVLAIILAVRSCRVCTARRERRRLHPSA